MRRIINLPEGPHYGDAYPLSHGAVAGDLVFAAGMAFDSDTGTRSAEAVTIADETRIVLDSLAKILADAGCTLGDVVKTTVYLAEREYYDEMNSVYRQYWESGDYPTRAAVYVGIGSECRVEIDAIAVRGAGSRGSSK